MKYLAKTFVETIPDWSPEELVSNAIASKQGYRFFGCSRDLSHIMKRPSMNHPGYTWLSTSMHCPDRGDEEDKIIRKNPTWKIENKPGNEIKNLKEG
jgi:hypothetical protein